MTKTKRHPGRMTTIAISLGQKCSGLKLFQILANQNKLVTLRFASYRPSKHTGWEYSTPPPILFEFSVKTRLGGSRVHP